VANVTEQTGRRRHRTGQFTLTKEQLTMTGTRRLLATAALAMTVPILAACQLESGAPQSTLAGIAGPGAGQAPTGTAATLPDSAPTTKNGPPQEQPKRSSGFTMPTTFISEGVTFANSPNPGGTSIIFQVPSGWKREYFRTSQDSHGEENFEIAFHDPTKKVMLRVVKDSPTRCCDPKTVLRDMATLLFGNAPGYRQVHLEDIACCHNSGVPYPAASLGIEYNAEGVHKRGEYRAVDMGDGVAIVALVTSTDLWAEALPVLDRAWTVDFAG
jgi:hypothetical protein